MITNKRELQEYLEADRAALRIRRKRPPLFGREIWKFEISLRHYEYWINTDRGIIGRLGSAYWKFWNHRYSMKLGFYVPPNVCGKGLNIHHWGCLVINPNVRIGENCNIQQCVNIGQNYTADQVPTIGNNVYIGPGAKLFGKINIADGCAIGAGAVVNKSFNTPNMAIAGNPAREIGRRKEGLH
jgi:serine O-acetyltransferase